ncbi:MAG: zinc protease [Bacteroidetes bacterium GWF2_38_335]|nr:MAG: zinc protease [Bacteroidetes bacterium GWF2_38_335]OFY81635.1 MAG: zinc protease [Bacteroidetes bacterium RIFOXYA12_FULL_38_20]HBS88989.1 peptidase M16 [Bacteroidales bacterium]
MEYKTFELDNGIRLIHLPVPNTVAYAGMIINAGTRDENEDEHGIAHFIEHVIFKGTKRRKAYHILSRMEDVGGDIDAYTTKEKTCLYATFMHNYYERTIDLISDILFNSVFPQKELEKEKTVIVDEINSYKDSPAEQIFDDFEEFVYPNHPLGRNILGTKKSLKSFKKSHIQEFMQRNYHTDQMVFCSVGNINFEKLVKIFSKYFSTVPENRKKTSGLNKPVYSKIVKTVKKNTFQSHCIMGNEAFSIMDKNRLSMVMLNNILGGPGLNSRLNLVLREKYGFVYNVESNYEPYRDCGLFSIYFGTDPDNLDRSMELINKELKLIKTKKMGTLQLHKAKNQIIGQVAISADSHSNLLFTLGKSYLIFGKVDDLETIQRKVEAISAETLIETANLILDDNQMSVLIYKK